MFAAVARLLRGSPGHPLHPPLTDVVIGALVAATAFSVAATAGLEERHLAPAALAAAVLGLVAVVPTAAAGLADYATIPQGTSTKRRATVHLLSNLAAAGLYLAGAVVLAGDAGRGDVPTFSLVAMLAGMAAMTLGGWLGGSLVFESGMRVERVRTGDGPIDAAPVAGTESQDSWRARRERIVAERAKERALRSREKTPGGIGPGV